MERKKTEKVEAVMLINIFHLTSKIGCRHELEN